MVSVDRQIIPMQMDKVYLFKPNHRERFDFSATQKTHHFWCSVAPQALPSDMKRLLFRLSANGLTPSECFHRLISTASLLSMTEQEEAQRVVDLLGVALFAEFLHLAKHAGSQPDMAMHRALRHMEDHLAEAECLEEARRRSGFSETAFIYKCKLATGHTPARYLWKLRTEKGIRLLSETGLSVAEIAYQCGFKNPFHFSRCVQQLQGASPRALRRSAWT